MRARPRDRARKGAGFNTGAGPDHTAIKVTNWRVRGHAEHTAFKVTHRAQLTRTQKACSSSYPQAAGVGFRV